MEVSINITDHNTTQEEQFKKFLEEFKEFQYELDYYAFKKWQKASNQALITCVKRVIDEGIDVCKTLQKITGKSSIHTVRLMDRSSSNMLQWVVKCIDFFKKSNGSGDTSDSIFYLLYFLAELAEENNIDLLRCVKENDNKNESRGVDRKLYLNKVDVLDLEEILSILTEDHDYVNIGESLTNIINKIEK